MRCCGGAGDPGRRHGVSATCPGDVGGRNGHPVRGRLQAAWRPSDCTAKQSSTSPPATPSRPGSVRSCSSSARSRHRPSATTSNGAGPLTSRCRWPNRPSRSEPPTPCCAPGARSGDRPFAVVNGDDVYGAPALELLAGFLADGTKAHANVAFALRDTIVTADPVTRGTCNVDDDGQLVGMTERRKVHATGGDRFVSDDGLEPRELAGDTPVSVNLWGLRPTIWPVLEAAVQADPPRRRLRRAMYPIPRAGRRHQGGAPARGDRRPWCATPRWPRRASACCAAQGAASA